jgi:hypothetical protein
MLWTIFTITILLGAGVAIYCFCSWITLWQKKVTVQERWINLTDRLARRFNAISKLADHCRPFMPSEVAAFRRLTRARDGIGVANRAVAEEELRLATYELLRIGLSYPDLLSDREFVSRCRSFNGVNDQVEFQLRQYNAAATRYNAAISNRWHRLTAHLMRLKPRQLFAVPTTQ